MSKMCSCFRRFSTQATKHILCEYAWIFRHSWQHKGAIVWYSFLGLLGTAVSLVGSVLSKYIIDAVTGQNNSGIVTALVFFVFMQVSQIGIHAISSRVSAKINLHVNQQITADVYDKLMAADWEPLSEYHSGDLLSRVVGDVATVSSSVLGWIPDLVTRMLQFLGTLGIILYYDSTLAVLALLSAPVTLLMSRLVMRKMRHHNEEIRKLGSENIMFHEESFQNVQLIKAFDQTEQYSRKHRDIQARYRKATLDYNLFSLKKSSLLSLVGTVVALVCFVWSIYRLWAGHITYGTMTLFLQLAGSLSATFSALAGLIPGAIGAATSAGRIMEITELKAEDRADEQTDAFVEQHRASPLSIQATGLSYRYSDGRSVLSQVDFEADAGSIVAFIGPSGEGKTTLLRLLLGILHPQDGQLTILSKDGQVSAVSPATRRLFAYVPQGNTLLSGTVAENLRLAKPDATEAQMWNALDIACASDFLRTLPAGLNTVVKEQGGGFSQGQLQRLCIARAVLADTPILLMDEATSALDAHTEQQVLRNIMQAEKNKTCIITTHRPGVLGISDRIYYVHDDRIQPITAEQFRQEMQLPVE